MPWKPGKEYRGIGKKVCQWGFNPDKFDNLVAILLRSFVNQCV